MAHFSQETRVSSVGGAVCALELERLAQALMKQLIQPQSRSDLLRGGIFAFTLFTALAHLYLGMQPDEELRFWFLLNGLGYLGLLAAFFLPLLAAFHVGIRWILLGYTLLTIILWFFLGGPSQGQLDPYDLAVKLDEAILVVLLFLDSLTLPSNRV